MDIYQFHTWSAKFNSQDEWFETFEELKQQGKVKASGVSIPDSTPDYVIGALDDGRIDSIQFIYNRSSAK